MIILMTAGVSISAAIIAVSYAEIVATTKTITGVIIIIIIVDVVVVAVVVICTCVYAARST